MKQGIFLISLILAVVIIGSSITWLQEQSLPSAAKGEKAASGSSAISSPVPAEPGSMVPAADGCPKSGVKWKAYTAPNHEFAIQYPGTTHPEISLDTQTALLSRTIFQFVQPFQTDSNNGSLRFSVQISVWRNPRQITAEAWAKQNTNQQLISDARQIQVGTFDGYILRETNQIAWVVHLFVARSDRIYEVTYTDIASNDTLISDATAACWKATLGHMIDSFRLQ